MRVTVLIPAHNEAGTIGRCIASVQASTYPVRNQDILVVADACTDHTADIACAAGVRVVEVAFADKADAQNHVLPLVDTELLVGVDADTFVRRDCIKRMVQAIVNRHLDAVCATVLPDQPRGFFVTGRRYAYALGRCTWRWAQSQVGRVQVLTGACYVFRTSAIRAVGGFHSVGIGSDMATTWALHEARHPMEYVGRAVATTMDPETWTGYQLQMNRWASGYCQTMARYRRQLWHPRSIIVVWTAIFDLATLPLTWALITASALIHPRTVAWYPLWVLGRMLLNTILVTFVLGWREAARGAVPFFLLNFYVKWLYMRTCFREWVLGRHYGTWTGRHGRPVQIHPMSPRRRYGLAAASAWALIAVAVVGRAVP